MKRPVGKMRAKKTLSERLREHPWRVMAGVGGVVLLLCCYLFFFGGSRTAGGAAATDKAEQEAAAKAGMTLDQWRATAEERADAARATKGKTAAPATGQPPAAGAAVAGPPPPAPTAVQRGSADAAEADRERAEEAASQEAARRAAAQRGRFTSHATPPVTAAEGSAAGPASPGDKSPPQDAAGPAENLATWARDGRLPPEGETFVLNLLTAPQEAAPPDASQIAAEKLRKLAMDVVDRVGSEGMRIRLARSLGGTSTAPDVREGAVKLLAAPRPENLAAQIVLCRGDQIDAPTRKLMEDQFVLCAQTTLRRAMHTETPVGGDARRAGAGVDVSLVARYFWRPEFADLVDRRLKQTDTLADAAPLVTLARMVPANAMRSVLRRTLEQHWSEGPGSLDSGAAALDAALGEPGFLVLVKTLPREDAPLPDKHDSASPWRPGKITSPTKTAPAQKTNRLDATSQAKHKDHETGQKWMKFSERLVRTWCRQLRAAAFAHGGDDGGPYDLPIPLPREVQPAAAYHLDWPAAAPAVLGGVAPNSLDVHYVRLEQKKSPNRVLGYFRRQLKSPVQRTLDDGVWLESLATDPRADQWRSIDVLVTRVGNGPLGPIDAEQELTVEVLVVEIPRPEQR